MKKRKTTLILALLLVVAALASACNKEKMPDADAADNIPVKTDTAGSPTSTPSEQEPEPTEQEETPIQTPDTIYKFDEVEKAKDVLKSLVGESEYQTADTGMGYIDYAPLPDSQHNGIVELRYYPNGVLAETSFIVESGELTADTIDMESLIPSESESPAESATPAPGESPKPDEDEPKESDNSLLRKSIADELQGYVNALTGQGTNENLSDELKYAFSNQHEPRELTIGEGDEAQFAILSYSDGKFRLSV
jgi:hypothetical protein